MNNDNMRRHLALAVMGWRECTVGLFEVPGFCDDKGVVRCDWNPLERWSDCGMLIEAFEYWTITRNTLGLWNAWCHNLNEITIASRAAYGIKTQRLAICLAAGKATGWTE